MDAADLQMINVQTALVSAAQNKSMLKKIKVIAFGLKRKKCVSDGISQVVTTKFSAESLQETFIRS